MLRITASQMAELGGTVRARFEARAAAYLMRVDSSAAALTRDAALRYVQAAHADARRHGIGTELGVIRFMNVALALGADFASNPAFPWVQDVLGDTDLEERLRLDLLVSAALVALGQPKPGTHDAGSLDDDA